MTEKLKKASISLIDFTTGIFGRTKRVIKVVTTKRLFKSESYYPEKKYKSSFRIFWEQIWHTLKHNEINEFYFVFGFDGKNAKEMCKYMPYSRFRTIRDNANVFPHEDKRFNYIGLLRDKFVFGQYLTSLSFKTPENIAFISNGNIRLLQSNTNISIEELVDINIDAFCKKIDGECGAGVFPLVINEGVVYMKGAKSSISELKAELGNSIFIIQERIKQHKDISDIYSKSINTIRLSTIFNRKTRTVEFFSATLRVGTKENYVDNWAMGGLIINIDCKGKLDKYGLYKYSYGTKTESHPDSNIVFQDYQIPNFDKIVEKAMELHTYYYGIHSIGWDIAIGEDGSPIFIEGNDNWDFMIPQATISGLKNEFLATL